MSLAIDARALTKKFGAATVVDDVDIAVEEGELFGLLGPNGAGKTTVVRMLTGLVPITSGTALIGGVDVARAPDRVRTMLGIVPQALTSDLDLTAHENMDLYARYFDVPRAERTARIEQLLTRTGLWERRKSLVRTFSGGMRRRLEIARGLIHKPRVLFLDEPTIGLDPQSRRVIWDLLRELKRGDSLTISLTTHYLDEAEVLCDRVAIVDAGTIVALGTPAELKAKVPGSDTIDLGLTAPPSSAVVAKVHAMPGVRAVTSPSATNLTVRADRGAELLPKLLGELAAASVSVSSASVTRVTLEDVFIHLTGRSLRDEGANRGGPQSPRARAFS